MAAIQYVFLVAASVLYLAEGRPDYTGGAYINGVYMSESFIDNILRNTQQKSFDADPARYMERCRNMALTRQQINFSAADSNVAAKMEQFIREICTAHANDPIPTAVATAQRGDDHLPTQDEIDAMYRNNLIKIKRNDPITFRWFCDHKSVYYRVARMLASRDIAARAQVVLPEVCDSEWTAVSSSF